MIIDSHVHLGRAYTWASYASYTFDTALGPREDFDAEVLLDLMDRLGIDKAAIMTSKQSLLAGDNSPENDDIAQTALAQPDKFLGMVILNPMKDRVLDDLTTYVQDYRVKALKLHAHAQGYSLQLPPVHALVERAAELGVPVMIHSGTPPYTTPLQIAPLAGAFPDATIVLAHMGLGETYAADAITAAEMYNNIYLETSICPAELVKLAIRTVGADRVMYGSDTPWNTTELELKKLDAIDLTPEERRSVLSETAMKVFNV